MKKVISRTIFAALVLCLILSSVNAEKFTPKGSDITIDINTDLWYVFTLDNLDNNPETDEIGLDVETIRLQMTSDNLIMFAVTSYDNENYFFLDVRKFKEDEVENLTPHSHAEIDEMAKKLVKDITDDSSFTINNQTIYQSNYKYILLDYTESDGYNHRTYVTVVNGYSYWFDFYLPKTINSSGEKYAEDVIKGTTYDVKDPEKKSTDEFTLKNEILIPVGTAVGVGGISFLAKKMKDKKKAKATEEGEQF